MNQDDYIIPPKEGDHASGDWDIKPSPFTPKRSLINLGELEIDIYHDRNPPQISITNPKKINGWGSAVEIPEDAQYFFGTIEQFVDLLQRMKKKYGHLYK